MTHLPNNSASCIDTSHTGVVRKLVVLEKKYGLPAQEVARLDEKALMRALATHDFLANNLPQGTFRAAPPCGLDMEFCAI